MDKIWPSQVQPKSAAVAAAAAAAVAAAAAAPAVERVYAEKERYA